MNIIDIIRRSANNHPLTPMERAFLKFLQGALFGVVIDAANIMIAYYQGGGTSTSVDWLHLLLIPLGTGFLSALIKWYSAQGDTDVEASFLRQAFSISSIVVLLTRYAWRLARCGRFTAGR